MIKFSGVFIYNCDSMLSLQCGNKIPKTCTSGGWTTPPRWDNRRYYCFKEQTEVPENHKFCKDCAHNKEKCPRCGKDASGGIPQQIPNDG